MEALAATAGTDVGILADANKFPIELLLLVAPGVATEGGWKLDDAMPAALCTGATVPIPASTPKANSRDMIASPPAADNICVAVSRDCVLSLPGAAYMEEARLLPSPLAAFAAVRSRPMSKIMGK